MVPSPLRMLRDCHSAAMPGACAGCRIGVQGWSLPIVTGPTAIFRALGTLAPPSDSNRLSAEVPKCVNFAAPSRE
jgi:hypothetical protein